MTAWITLAAAGLLTLALRAGPSMVAGEAPLPRGLQRVNRFAAAALMGALASRSIAGQAARLGAVDVLTAVAVAIPVAMRTRSMTWTMLGGAATYLVAVALHG